MGPLKKGQPPETGCNQREDGIVLLRARMAMEPVILEFHWTEAAPLGQELRIRKSKARVCSLSLPSWHVYPTPIINKRIDVVSKNQGRQCWRRKDAEVGPQPPTYMCCSCVHTHKFQSKE